MIINFCQTLINKFDFCKNVKIKFEFRSFKFLGLILLAVVAGFAAV